MMLATLLLQSSSSGISDSTALALIGLIILVVVVCIMISFMPTYIAFKRRHRNRVPIMLINIFFGWTILGWVGALCWAFTADVEVES